MDAASFREVMRHQAGAVALICTGRTGARYGLTATGRLLVDRRSANAAGLRQPNRQRPRHDP